MKLYSISDEYVSFLRKKYPRVYSNKEDVRIHTRKYLGVVMEIEGYKFYIPLSSPKKHDYVEIDGKRRIRKDSLIVMRIVCGKDQNKELKGTLQIGTMIPVPNSEIVLYDVDGEQDQAYKDLIEEELIYIRKNKDKIQKNARVLYSKKKAGNNENKVVANCLDYIAVCKECDAWIKKHEKM